jgi:glucose/mannose transport system substrate-binding protein
MSQDNSGQNRQWNRRNIMKLVGTVSVAGLAGCSGGDGGDGSGDGGGSETTQIDWMTYPQSETFTAWFVDGNEGFTQADNGKELNGQILDVENYKAQIGTYLGTDQAPDVFVMWNGPGRAGSFVAEEDLVPVSDVVSEDLLNQYESGLDVWKFTDGNLQTWKEEGGDVYGIPNYIAGCPIWYNVQVLEEAGIDPDSIKHKRDMTYDEFVTILETVRDETDYVPLSIGNNAGGHNAYMLTGLWHSLVGAEAYLEACLGTGDTKFTDPEMVRAAELIQELYEQELINQDTLALSENEASARFFQNEAAFNTDGMWITGLYEQYADKDEIGPMGEGYDYVWYPVFPDTYPNGENERFIMQVDGCCVTQQAIERGNGEAVGEYLEHIYSRDRVASFIENTGLISLHEDAAELADMPPTTEAMLQDIQDAEGRAEKIDLATYPEASQTQYDQSQRIYQGADPEDIMQEIQASVDRAVSNL